MEGWRGGGFSRRENKAAESGESSGPECVTDLRGSRVNWEGSQGSGGPVAPAQAGPGAPPADATVTRDRWKTGRRVQAPPRTSGRPTAPRSGEALCQSRERSKIIRGGKVSASVGRESRGAAGSLRACKTTSAPRRAEQAQAHLHNNTKHNSVAQK